MSLLDSQTETWRHSDATVSGLGPLAKTLIPTPHNSPFCVLETCTCQETRAKRSERETEEARTGPNEKEEGHLSAKGWCVFLSSQQGRLQVDAGHDATAPSLTSEHNVLCPSTSPGRFWLGPAWISFFLPPALLGQGIACGLLCWFFSVGCCAAPGGDVTT